MIPLDAIEYLYIFMLPADNEYLSQTEIGESSVVWQRNSEMWGLEVTLNSTYDEILKGIDGLNRSNSGSLNARGNSGDEIKQPVVRPR